MMPKSKSYTPKDVIAIDINEKKIVYGNDTINMEVNTGIDRAYRYKVLAESLQKKYS
jgi:transposase